MPCSRRFGFEGDNTAYIWYLEERIFALEKILHSTSRQDTYIEALHPSRGQDNFANNPGKDFEVARYHESRVPDRQGWDDGTQPVSETPPSPGDEQHNHEAEDAVCQWTGLEIIEYNPLSMLPKGSGARSKIKKNKQPGSSPNKNEHRRGSGGQQLRVKSELDKFLEDLPSLKDWKPPIDEARRRIVLRELVRDYGSAAPTCTSLNKVFKTPSGNSAEPANIIPILRQYRQFTVRSSSIDRKIAYFRELVFVSLCAVALRVHEDKDQVYEVMRDFRGSNAQSKYLNKLVCGAKWANRAISLLSQTKWASRSWSVIFDAEHPIGFYARFAEFSTETKKLFLGRVRENTINDSSELAITDEAAPLVVPLIVERLFKNTTSLEVICKCLGYNCKAVNSYRLLFDQALSPHSNKRANTSAQLGLSKRRCQGQRDPPVSDCDDDTLRPRSQHLMLTDGKPPDTQLNLEQSNGIFDKATSLSSRTLQSRRSLSLDLQTTLISSTHESPRANPDVSALVDPFPASDFPRDDFNNLPNLPESDPFPASDFPQDDFNNIPNLPECDPPPFLADPFPVSDFPQDDFNNIPNLPECDPPPFLADPFPVSDFPQDDFNNIPNLPECDPPPFLADPFPVSDFPQDDFNNIPNLPECDPPPFLADPFSASDFPHGFFNAPPALPLSNIHSILARSLPLGDKAGTPKGCSVNSAVTREPGDCSTGSVATPGSRQGSLAGFPVCPSSHLPNLTSSVLHSDTSERLFEHPSGRAGGYSTVSGVSNFSEHARYEVQIARKHGHLSWLEKLVA